MWEISTNWKSVQKNSQKYTTIFILYTGICENLGEIPLDQKGTLILFWFLEIDTPTLHNFTHLFIFKYRLFTSEMFPEIKILMKICQKIYHLRNSAIPVGDQAWQYSITHLQNKSSILFIPNFLPIIETSLARYEIYLVVYWLSSFGKDFVNFLFKRTIFLDHFPQNIIWKGNTNTCLTIVTILYTFLM